MQNAIWLSSILDFPSSLVAALPHRAAGDGTLGPALNHENYETNPKQFLRILFKGNGFAQSGWFFAGKTNPKLPGPWTGAGCSLVRFRECFFGFWFPRRLDPVSRFHPQGNHSPPPPWVTEGRPVRRYANASLSTDVAGGAEGLEVIRGGCGSGAVANGGARNIVKHDDRLGARGEHVEAVQGNGAGIVAQEGRPVIGAFHAHGDVG